MSFVIPGGAGLFSAAIVDKGGQVFNVKAYNAVGNGITDDTNAIQSAYTAGAGQTVFFPKGQYLITSQIVVPLRTKTLGVSSSQPFTHDGATILVGGSLNTDLFTTTNIGSGSDYWSHGMVFEALTFVARVGQTIGSGIYWVPGEDSMIRDCTFFGFPDAGVRLTKQFAPCVMENICCYNNRYGVWFGDCNGSALILGLTGDDNLSMVNVEMSVNDPNVWGAGLNITIAGLKTETQSSNGANAHDPVIRMFNANEAAIKIVGGFSTDVSSISSGTKSYCHILQNGGSSTPTAIVTNGTTWTVTVPSTFGWYGGQTDVLSGFTPSGYNGTFTIASIVDATHYTITNATQPGAITVFGINTITGNAYSGQVQIEGVHVGKYPNLFKDDTVGGQTILWTPYSGVGSDDFPNFRKVWHQYRMPRSFYSDAPSGFIADAGMHGLTVQGANAPYIRFQRGVSNLPRTNGVGLFVCSGSPNSQITADIGSLCTRVDGGAVTTLYVKESGNGLNTGWVAK